MLSRKPPPVPSQMAGFCFIRPHCVRLPSNMQMHARICVCTPSLHLPCTLRCSGQGRIDSTWLLVAGCQPLPCLNLHSHPPRCPQSPPVPGIETPSPISEAVGQPLGAIASAPALAQGHPCVSVKGLPITSSLPAPLGKMSEGRSKWRATALTCKAGQSA